MAEDDALSDDEVIRAINWINEKAVSPTDACPVCGSEKNGVFPALTQIKVGDVPNPGTMPTVMTICRNCGFMRFFNAVTMGLREGDWPPQKAEEENDASAAP